MAVKQLKLKNFREKMIKYEAVVECDLFEIRSNECVYINSRISRKTNARSL